MKKWLFSVPVMALLALTATPASATLLLDRGLPDSNLNNAAGANRSNVAWDFAGLGFFAGDDFTIAGSGTIAIDTIKMWVIPDSGGAASANNNADLGDDGVWHWGDTYSEVRVYLGPTSDVTVPLLESGAFVGAGSNALDNPSMTFARDQYPSLPPQDYQGGSGLFIQLYELTLNVNITLEAGVEYQFGLECRGPNDTDGGTPNNFSDDVVSLCFTHATNAALAGTPQQGSDNLYRFFSVGALNEDATSGGPTDSHGNGWDKSSDANIKIFGEFATAAVPEPGTLAIFAIGLLVITVFGGRRLEQKKA